MNWSKSKAQRPKNKWWRLLQRFWSSPRLDTWLLLECVWLLPLIGVALRFVKFRRVYNKLAKSLPYSSSQLLPTSANQELGISPKVESIWRCVRVSARIHRKHFTCLPQALLLWWLLKRRGFPCELRIGVRKEQTFEAHAWVEHFNYKLELVPSQADTFIPFDKPINPN